MWLKDVTTESVSVLYDNDLPFHSHHFFALVMNGKRIWLIKCLKHPLSQVSLVNPEPLFFYFLLSRTVE